jgi:hypothetical protein
MGLADRAAQSVGRLRNRDQMDVVRHQTVCRDFHLVSAAPLTHKVPARLVIVVTEERPLPAVSPLGDEVGHSPEPSFPIVGTVLTRTVPGRRPATWRPA